MRSVLTSHVTQLLYRSTPQLNFAHVISDLCEAFTPDDDPSPVLAWDCDDIAVLDFIAARVVVGFTEHLPGAHVACLTVAIGQSPLDGCIELAYPDQNMLGNQITDFLHHWFPSDAQHRQVLEQTLTPDLIDQLGDALFQAQPAEPLQTVVNTTVIPDAPIPPLAAEPSDMDRLMLRLSSELVARKPNIITRAIASATPKARNGAGTEQPKPQPSTFSDFPKVDADKPRAGLFWGKARPAVPLGKNASTSLGPRPQSLNELKAVRDALCADDAAEHAGNVRLAVQTRQAFQTLTGLSHGLASAVSGKRRADAPQTGNQIKN